MVESFTYDNHYGKIIEHIKLIETNNPYAYTGRELDTDELYYYRARYYDPTLERFLSEDPIGFASGDFNWYRYVLNDPVNLVDPSGKIPLLLILEIAGTISTGYAIWNWIDNLMNNDNERNRKDMECSGLKI